MEEEIKPKKIYKPEELEQARKDLFDAIKKTMNVFSENSNISGSGIKYESLSVWLNLDVTE